MACLWLFLPFVSLAIAVVPLPTEHKETKGVCSLNRKIVALPHKANMELRFEAEYLNHLLKTHNSKNVQNAKDLLPVQLRIDKKMRKNPKQHVIRIMPNGLVIAGGSAEAVFHGVNTFAQMVLTSNAASPLSCALIRDEPKFHWRGMHLDVCRHFFPVDFIKKYIDLLALYKMNVFHWHLTEDQGWRIEIKKYPKLTEVGAWRKGTMIGPYDNQEFDSIPYGGFYTQEEIKDIVRYAAERHITVVPEIEMPGHALAALAAYPQFSCTGGPFEVAKGWGVFDDVFCVNDQTFQFIEDVLTEVLALFPSEYIHIGGDECPKVRWKSCPKCQNTMRQNGIKDEHELQSYFIRRVEKFLNTKGRKLIGWDEILEGGLAPGAAVMSWRGTQGGIEAARMKHKVVMTPGSHCYFDHYQGNPKYEPLAFGGYTTLEKVYGYNPIPAELNVKEAQYILGAQGNVWTEYMKSEKQVQYMVLPRLLALSEVLWGTANPAQYEQFVQRVEQHMKYIFRALGYNFSKSIYEINLNTEAKDGVLYVRLSSSTIKQLYFDFIKDSPDVFLLNDLGASKYNGPIPIRTSGMLNYNHNFDGRLNETLGFVQEFMINKATAKPIELVHQPHPNYAVGGAHTLVDGIQSDGKHFGNGWLGFSGTDLVATIDLMQESSIKIVGVNLLQRIGSWIHYPQEVLFEASFDGQVYFPIATANRALISEMNGKLRIPVSSTRPVRYVRITAKNLGQIPDKMPGAGHKAWLFAEEIVVE